MNVISALFLIAEIHSTTNFEIYEEVKDFCNTANAKLHMKNHLKKNAIHLLVCVPFSVGSICKF